MGKRHLLDDGRLVQAGSGIKSAGVLDEEHFVRRRVPAASSQRLVLGAAISVIVNVPRHRLVENGVLLRSSDQSQRRIAADDVVELGVVDVKRLRRQAFVVDSRPEELLT